MNRLIWAFAFSICPKARIYMVWLISRWWEVKGGWQWKAVCNEAGYSHGLISTSSWNQIQTLWCTVESAKHSARPMLQTGLSKQYRPIPVWPQGLSWMHVPTGNHEAMCLIPAMFDNILSQRLILKYFLRDWSWNIFYGHSLPSADSRRAVVSTGERMCTILVNRLED